MGGYTLFSKLSLVNIQSKDLCLVLNQHSCLLSLSESVKLLHSNSSVDMFSIQLLLSVTAPLSGMSSSSSSIESQPKEYTKSTTAELEIESINTESYLPDGKLATERIFYSICWCSL